MFHRRFHHPHRHFHHGHRFASPMRRLRHHLVTGGALVAIGVGVLLHSQGLVSTNDVWLVGPAVLAWSALVRLATGLSPRAVAGAVMRLGVAAYLVIAIEHVGGWTFATTWPVLLIAAGAAHVAHALFWRRLHAGAACEGPAS